MILDDVTGVSPVQQVTGMTQGDSLNSLLFLSVLKDLPSSTIRKDKPVRADNLLYDDDFAFYGTSRFET